MALLPKLIGPTISLITGLITSTTMSFVGLAMNYGFQPDFAVRWLRAAATSYVVIVPMLVLRHSADPALRHAAGRNATALSRTNRELPAQAGPPSSSFERNPRSAT